eukprot:TRINITY_DN10571_c0_g1_i1.p1 TRINITY_DN10571_c0_g1~~TRINITY_DN10571_c0_g1_i1.p1  ORF type:complete len:390 (+),score=53.79 TRINITY_DN10571_c0_g1_i1:210-1379(+)
MSLSLQDELKSLENELALIDSQLNAVNGRLKQPRPLDPTSLMVAELAAAEKRKHDKRKSKSRTPAKNPKKVGTKGAPPSIVNKRKRASSASSRVSKKAKLAGAEYNGNSGFDRQVRPPNSGPFPTRDPKKIRSVSRYAKLFPDSPHFEYCLHLVDQLIHHPYGAPFSSPVDPVALKIPAYFDIVQHPQDLGTVRKNLLSGKYKSVFEFGEDVRLVWRNALKFNHPDSDIHMMSQTLFALFEESLNGAIALEVAPSKISNSEVQHALTSLKERLGETQAHLLSLRRHGVNWSKDPDYATFFQSHDPRVVKRSLVPLRQFTKEEKEELTNSICSVVGEDLRVIVMILEEEMPQFLPRNSREIEIDLSLLDDFTLSRLQNFVDTLATVKGGK